MRYLAVAHFGRGRGEFVSGSRRRTAGGVSQALMRRRASLDALWAGSSQAGEAATAAGLLPLLTQSAQEVLIQLYPDVAFFKK